ncbi:MAG: prolipoprotein diacylglyceryl transferase [Deltaproteobacteria bacterium]|nr:prolipoprotein diacylglyceryl transferase [Deltaproteobacteria bacterium]
MHPVLFRIGPFTVNTYGFFIAVGFLLGLLVILRDAKRQGIAKERVMDLAFYMLLAGIVASRLAYVALNPERFSDFWEIFRIWNGGLVFYGGFLGAAAVYFVYLKRHEMNMFKTADLLTPAVPLAHAFGRLGCFSAGCCYGEPCDLPWAVTFNHPLTLAPRGVPLHPTQLYGAAGNFAIFLLVYFLVRPKKRFDGMVFFFYVILYAALRFVIEFFRGDYRGEYLAGALSPSQAVAAAALAVSVFFLVRLRKRTLA